MKQSALIIIVIIVILIITVPISLWYLVFEKPIKADPTELVLSNDELPGWEYVQDDSYSNAAIRNYQNTSVEVGYHLRIIIGSFGSSGEAHDYYYLLRVSPDPSGPALGDEGGRSHGKGWLQVLNGTSYLIEESIHYDYREANIVVSINFETYGTEFKPLDPNGTYYEPWMDNIAIQQMSKIDSFNIHIL